MAAQPRFAGLIAAVALSLPAAASLFEYRPIAADASSDRATPPGEVAADPAPASVAPELGVVRQRTAYDCGVAAMAMILGANGIEVEYEELWSALGTAADGTTMKAMKDVAERRGLECAGILVVSRDATAVTVPAVLLLNRRHFVVFDGCDTSGDCMVRDPALGLLRVPRARLESEWGGETLMFRREHGGRSR
jgi:ABC-type bacteriocin/lantibiotic exporter with double-glycine peptidase domain